MFSFGRKTRVSRKRVDKPAWLVFDGDFALRPVVVVDLSDTGALLKLDQVPERMPKRFTLTFTRGSRAGRQCEVRWKHGRSVGVKFV